MPFRRICCPACGHVHCKVLAGRDYPPHAVICPHSECRSAFQWEIRGGKLLVVAALKSPR